MEMMTFFSFGLNYLLRKNAEAHTLSPFLELRERYFQYKEDYAYAMGERDGINKGKKMSEEEFESVSLKMALGGEARQCKKCSYGPLLRSHCSSIGTHQMEI